MGRKSYNLETVLYNRPTLEDYPALLPDVKELVDYTVQECLKANPVLRLKRFAMTKYINPNKIDLWDLPWSDIIELRIAITGQNIEEVFRIIYGIGIKDFPKLDVFNAFAAYKWIVEEFGKVAELEVQELSSNSTEEEIEAGSEELQRFGVTVVLDSLTKGKIPKRKKYLRIQYKIIFEKLCLDKTKMDIRKTMAANASRKAKANRAN